MVIRDFRVGLDEVGWVRCRTLAFLNTAYFDDVETSKPRYDRAAVELVAEADSQIIGVLDAEIEVAPLDRCSDPARAGAVVWTIAVHPDYRRRGVASALLTAAAGRCRALGPAFLEAWTRDDEWVRDWCEQSGFAPTDRYLHVYLTLAAGAAVRSPLAGKVTPVLIYGHAKSEDRGAIEPHASRIHECVRYVRELCD